MIQVIRANPTHVELIVRHRVELLRTMGWDSNSLELTAASVREHLEENWDDGPICFLAYKEKEVVGGCALASMCTLPTTQGAEWCGCIPSQPVCRAPPEKTGDRKRDDSSGLGRVRQYGCRQSLPPGCKCDFYSIPPPRVQEKGRPLCAPPQWQDVPWSLLGMLCRSQS